MYPPADFLFVRLFPADTTALSYRRSLWKVSLTAVVVLLGCGIDAYAQRYPAANSDLILNPSASNGKFGRQGAGALRGLVSPDSVNLTGSVLIGLSPTGGVSF